VSTRRFFAFLALACWLVLTPITLWTGQQWIDQATQFDILSRQTSPVVDGPDPRAAEAFSIAEKRRQEFWREVAAWVVITITASALLAEHRRRDDHRAERTSGRLQDPAQEHVSQLR
jgi:thiosulfate reductase cytochrome b subunit